MGARSLHEVVIQELCCNYGGRQNRTLKRSAFLGKLGRLITHSRA